MAQQYYSNLCVSIIHTHTYAINPREMSACVQEKKKKDLYLRAHGSCIHSSQEVKAVQISLNRNMGEQIAAFGSTQQ